jgi:hypothetical protein
MSFSFFFFFFFLALSAASSSYPVLPSFLPSFLWLSASPKATSTDHFRMTMHHSPGTLAFAADDAADFKRSNQETAAAAAASTKQQAILRTD